MSYIDNKIKDMINISPLPKALANKVLGRTYYAHEDANSEKDDVKVMDYDLDDFKHYVKDNSNLNEDCFDLNNKQNELLKFVFPTGKIPHYNKFYPEIMKLRINDNKNQILYGQYDKSYRFIEGTFNSFLYDVWSAILKLSSFTHNIPSDKTNLYIPKFEMYQACGYDIEKYKQISINVNLYTTEKQLKEIKKQIRIQWSKNNEFKTTN